MKWDGQPVRVYDENGDLIGVLKPDTDLGLLIGGGLEFLFGRVELAPELRLMYNMLPEDTDFGCFNHPPYHYDLRLGFRALYTLGRQSRGCQSPPIGLYLNPQGGEP